MAGTRSSSRLAASSSSPSSSQNNPPKSAGTKRKQENSATPSAKRGRSAGKKEQKTIEETLLSKPLEEAVTPASEKESENNEAEDKRSASRESHTNGKAHTDPNPSMDNKDETPVKSSNQAHDGEANGDSSTLDGTGENQFKESDSTGKAQSANGDTAVEPSEREQITPSSILEKGIIYFFFRGRVGIDKPQDVDDIARSYIVLRPLPHGAKLGDGPVGDAGNCRLLALPKKVLPASGKDKFLVFVESTKLSFTELKESFLSSSDYATKTAGTRHTPATTPIGEGVYAITTTGRDSHLAYILTIPTGLSEVQKDIGLRERGSFNTSAKNPQYPGPANASLSQGAEYPKEIIDEFRNLRWMPLQPKLLDYPNTQFLLIGESHGELSKAVEPQPGDKKHDKETPLEEMEKLEYEDEMRTKGLEDDDAVFADLGLSSKEYPKMQTTW